eukprot:CAMPEP_0174938454 /NCGR_PEP_ID=MMETSP1355-20121228/63528_1 /TAXON_ID=464990 /ORGANISM="Hemiselmis tepida, Strain CCMP443" /LENGTH=97 /DNA_ID=CAMNT_0016185381 /DNA_START=17 /DNA_END=310 /DNA_ORIENTATION=+
MDAAAADTTVIEVATLVKLAPRVVVPPVSPLKLPVSPLTVMTEARGLSRATLKRTVTLMVLTIEGKGVLCKQVHSKHVFACTLRAAASPMDTATDMT